MRGVQETNELRRILALPKRDSTYHNLVEELSQFLSSLHDCKNCNVTRLNLMQTQALAECWDRNGLFLQGPMGSGKTLVSLLLATVFDAQRALLVIPGGSAVDKTVADWKDLRTHWRLLPLNLVPKVPGEPAITVVTYEFLSQEENANWLEEFNPDLCIFDESHRMKNKRCAVHRRAKRFREKHPAVPYAIMSGTPAKRSINDFAPSMHWALGEFCPLPNIESDLVDWSACLDAAVKDYARVDAGALSVFGNNIQDIRRGVRHRIFSTPGAIACDTIDIDSELVIHLQDLPLSPAEDGPYEALYRDMALPDGHSFTDAIELWRHARELAVGFYSRWDPFPPLWWLNPRREWHKLCREKLSHSRTMDTAKQVATWADNHPGTDIHKALEAWRKVEKKFEPNVSPVWVGETALMNAATWLQDGGIVWVEHVPFGERLSALTGVPYFGEEGKSAEGQSIVHYTGKAMIASWHANGTGLNLQRWNRGLIASMWPTATWWDQTMARQHRTGQKSPQVVFDVPISCREQLAGFERASTEDAAFHHDLLAIPSRLIERTLKSDRITQRGFAWASLDELRSRP